MARKWKMDKETVEYLDGLLFDIGDLPGLCKLLYIVALHKSELST